MPDYKCEKCNYKTNHKSTFNNHLKSKKHYKATLKCFNCHKQYKQSSKHVDMDYIKDKISEFVDDITP